MNIEQYASSGIISLLIAIVVLFFRQSMIEMIKRFFTSTSDRQVRAIYLLLLMCLAIIPFLYPHLFTVSEDVELSEPVTNAHAAEASVTREELIDKGIDVSLEIAEDIVKRKRIRDSVLLANRPERWVYKIGVSSGRKNPELYKMFEMLNPKGNIYAFQGSKRSYFLIKDDNSTLDQLKANLEGFRKSLPFNSRVEIVNLMDYCKLKENIAATDMVTWRKAETNIPCLACSK